MEKRNRIFLISFKYTTNISMKVEVDYSWLWHRRFGHFNSEALKLLYQKNMMRDMPCMKESNESVKGIFMGSSIVYFLKEKLKVFEIFKKFKALVEKQSKKHINVLRNDRNKEYNSYKFDKFFEDEGIE
ncbi:hypothetical protein CR513_50326, partial [Mucuna pruriens]